MSAPLVIHFDYDKAAAQPVGHGYDARPPGTDLTAITLHSTEHGPGQTFAAAARYLRDSPDVSAHYLIGPDGTIQRVLDAAWRAWHAGVSRWRDVPDCNDYSVGIEIFHRAGEGAYPAPQLAAVAGLVRALMTDHATITKAGLHLHRWCALPPGRKIDPSDLSDDWWRGWITAL